MASLPSAAALTGIPGAGTGVALASDLSRSQQLDPRQFGGTNGSMSELQRDSLSRSDQCPVYRPSCRAAPPTWMSAEEWDRMVWEQRVKQRRTFLNMDESDNFDVDLARLNEANNEQPIDKNLLRKGA